MNFRWTITYKITPSRINLSSTTKCKIQCTVILITSISQELSPDTNLKPSKRQFFSGNNLTIRCHMIMKSKLRTLCMIIWVFSVSSTPALLTKLLFPPLADMLSWAVWFKFLLNKVIANTYLFILTSFSKQSASWKVLEICELCAVYWLAKDVFSD